MLSIIVILREADNTYSPSSTGLPPVQTHLPRLFLFLVGERPSPNDQLGRHALHWLHYIGVVVGLLEGLIFMMGVRGGCLIIWGWAKW